jgi:hypothetical protein
MKTKDVKKAAEQVAKKTARAMKPVIKKAKRVAEDVGDEIAKQSKAITKKALLASSKKLKKAAKAI